MIMAERAEVETRYCYVWRTRKSREGFGRSFPLSNAVLRLSMRADGDMYIIYIHDATGKGSVVNCAVTTCLEDLLPNSLALLPVVTTVESIGKGETKEIWRYPQKEISKVLRDFESGGEFKVVCMFHTSPPSYAIQHRNETISEHSSSRRDFNRPHSSSSNSETGTLDVTDLCGPLLELCTAFVVKGEMPNLTDDVIVKMYLAAVRYTVDSLKKACWKLMISSLSKENCLRVLSLAHTHNDQYLKNEVISYIVNHIEVIKRQDWIKFKQESIDVAIDVCEIFIHKKHFS